MSSNQETSFQFPKHNAEISLPHSQNNQTIYCPKHPEKKLKFLLKNEKDQKFCSKCALIEALKGGKLELDLTIFGINK